MKDLVKQKLREHPTARSAARSVYLASLRVYNALTRVPLLGSVISAFTSIIRMPSDVRIARSGMADIQELREYIPSLVNFMDGAEANFRKFQRMNNELTAALRTVEARVDELEKALQASHGRQEPPIVDQDPRNEEP